MAQDATTLHITRKYMPLLGLLSIKIIISSPSLLSHSNHKALSYIDGQPKLNTRQANWVEFLQSYISSCKYKSGKENIIVDALSRRYALLPVLEARILDFYSIKALYIED